MVSFGCQKLWFTCIHKENSTKMHLNQHHSYHNIDNSHFRALFQSLRIHSPFTNIMEWRAITHLLELSTGRGYAPWSGETTALWKQQKQIIFQSNSHVLTSTTHLPFKTTNGIFWEERACALLDYMPWIHFLCLPLEKWKTTHTLGVL